MTRYSKDKMTMLFRNDAIRFYCSEEGEARVTSSL